MWPCGLAVIQQTQGTFPGTGDTTAQKQSTTHTLLLRRQKPHKAKDGAWERGKHKAWAERLTRRMGRAEECEGAVITRQERAQPSHHPSHSGLCLQPDGSTIPLCNQRKRKLPSPHRRNKTKRVLCSAMLILSSRARILLHYLYYT